MTVNVDWTDDEVAFLRKAWEVDGLSAGQIAKKLSNRSRAAVCAQVGRMKLLKHGRGRTHTRSTAPNKPLQLTHHVVGRMMKIEVNRNPPVPVPVAAANDGAHRVLLENISPGYSRCRFPLWPNNVIPQPEEMFYCGERTEAKSPWCSSCAARVFNPLALRQQYRKTAQ